MSARRSDTASVVPLVSGLPPEEVEYRLKHSNRETDIANRTLAFYLYELHIRRLYQKWGHPSAVVYAVNRLHMSKSRAAELLQAGEALEALPVIDSAFCERKLTWSKVRLLCRVAVPETEKAWLDRALPLSSEELRREVKRCHRGEAPKKGSFALSPRKFLVQGFLAGDSFAEWEQARALLASEHGGPLSDAEVMQLACHVVLESRREDSTSKRASIEESIYKVVLQCCPECERSVVRTREEGDQPVDRATAERIACDAGCVSLEEGASRDDPTPPWLRLKILARDGFRCQSCASSFGLMAHHIVWRGRGGRTVPENLIPLCVLCHSLVHEGYVVITGKAPHDVTMRDREGRLLTDSGEPVGRVLARMREEAASGHGVLGVPTPRQMPSAAADFGGEKCGARCGCEAECGGLGVPTLRQMPSAAADSILTLHALPASASAEWFQRHATLFTWNERRGLFEFETGYPQEPGSNRPLSMMEGPFLKDLIGQERAVRSLDIAVRAARKRGTPVPHTLLSGPPGLGKTTLAHAVSAEIGRRTHATCGPLLKDTGALLGLLTSAGNGDVIFIDEIHALPSAVSEALYEALAQGTLSFPITDGTFTTTLRIELQPFTLIGATTELYKLPSPLLSRFTIREEVEFYSPADLERIVRKAADNQDVPVTPEVAQLLARAARGTPREALTLLKRLEDEAVVKDLPAIDASLGVEALAALGIDRDGLTPTDRKIVRTLRARPMGIKRLAASLALQLKTVRDVHEPFLLRQGWIEITHRGRMCRKRQPA